MIIILTLDKCKLGEKYIINSLECDGDIRRRFLDLGIIPSTEIIPVFNSPFGNPVAYRVRGTTIAIRKKDSRYIKVTPRQKN